MGSNQSTNKLGSKSSGGKTVHSGGTNKSTKLRKKVPYLTKFVVSTVRANIVQELPRFNKNCHIATELDVYSKANLGEILQGSTFPSKCLPANNGFVNAVVEAYNHHHHLILRPDDIWLSIMTQFSFYVNSHEEKFRKQFVSFEGKQELVVKFYSGDLRTVSYESFVGRMEEEIDKNLVDPEIRNWIMPQFSTTTKDDKVVAGIVFMAVMKNYFDYTCSILCGIPSITLDGTLEDWTEIKRRLDKLKTYGLRDWGDLLELILDQFIAAKSGEADVQFWSRICHISEGSGTPFLSGWIAVFCLFDVHGNSSGGIFGGWEHVSVMLESIPPGIVEVDVKVEDNGNEYKTGMLAGSMAIEVKDQTTLKPKSGWVIALKKEVEEKLESDV